MPDFRPTEVVSRPILGSVWRLINSVLLIVACFAPWINGWNILNILLKWFQWSLMLEHKVVLLYSSLALLLLLILLGIYPLINLRYINKSTPTNSQRGLVYALVGSWVIFICLVLAYATFLKLITWPIFSWGFWLYGVAMVSSTLVEIFTVDDARRRRWLISTFAVGSTAILILWGFSLGITSAKEGTIVLLNGTLLDGTGAEPMPNVVILIQGNKIVAIGNQDTISYSTEAKILDAKGGWILPGIINAHVHNAYSVRNLETWISAGVTTVCDLGAPVTFPFFILSELTQPYTQFAGLAVAGPIITTPGGYPIAYHKFPSLVVSSVESAQLKIQELLAFDPELVKISLESHFEPRLSGEETALIVEAAHKQNIPVAAHIGTIQDLITASEAGVDSIHHMVKDDITEAQIREMIETDLIWVPTMEAMAYFHGDAGLENVRNFASAGGKVALGNDVGYLDGLQMGMPIREMERMLNAGLTPIQIITASTMNAAKVCGLEEHTGTIEVGKVADLIIATKDPLQDIHSLNSVELVIHQGEIIRNEIP